MNRFKFSVSWTTLLVMFGVAGVIGLVIEMASRPPVATRSDETMAGVGTGAASSLFGTTATEPHATDVQSLRQRLDQLEGLIHDYDGRLREVRASEESKSAVERAQTAVLVAEIKGSRERLRKVKALEAAWQAQTPTVTGGDSGRRIAASPSHLKPAFDLLERERPTADRLLQWETQLEALATPVESAAQGGGSLIALVPEHLQRLNDLGSQITRALAEFEQQSLLLDELVKATADKVPGSRTLQSVLDERRIAEAQAHSERVVTAQRAARAEAEKLQVETLAQLERETVEAETRIKAIERRTAIAGLNDQAAKAQAALTEAEDERAFERDLPQINTLLASFLAPGYTLRSDKSKGPASFSQIAGSGALATNRPGMEALMNCAITYNDRPLVGLPRHTGGDHGWNQMPKEPVEKAQALLTKWGPMLVKKGMLAP